MRKPLSTYPTFLVSLFLLAACASATSTTEEPTAEQPPIALTACKNLCALYAWLFMPKANPKRATPNPGERGSYRNE